MLTIEERDNLVEAYEEYKNLLTQTQKQALHLYLIEDLSIVEVANVLVTTRQAANDAIKKGSKKLLSIVNKLK